MDKLIEDQASAATASTSNKKTTSLRSRFLLFLTSLLPEVVKKAFLRFDQKVDGALSFFFKHYGKTRFMIAMSKKSQYLGIERLWYKGPKAFIYFFLFYLVRDTILYIIIPIFFAKLTS
jgi:hypothetical protein